MSPRKIKMNRNKETQPPERRKTHNMKSKKARMNDTFASKKVCQDDR